MEPSRSAWFQQSPVVHADPFEGAALAVPLRVYFDVTLADGRKTCRKPRLSGVCGKTRLTLRQGHR